MPDQTLLSLSKLVYWVITIYVWIVIFRVIISWVSPSPYSSLMRFVSSLTDPPLNWFRKRFPLILGGLDFSPFIFVIALAILRIAIVGGLQLRAVNQPLSILWPFMAYQLTSMIQSFIVFLGIIMVIRLIMSLVNPSFENPLVLFIYAVTEPLLSPLRRWFPYGPRGLDVKALVFLIAMVVAYLLLDQLRMVFIPYLPTYGTIVNAPV
ncbi:MAG: YggT family protein [Deltaproteobacteria bacterium]|nr:YggT family protein [Deltaproteobacteria bacterium]